MKRRYLGLHKAPRDRRDYLCLGLYKDKVLPVEHDLRDKMTRITNQLAEGACVGFAGVAIKEYQEQIDCEKFVDLSERYLYSLSRDRGGYKEGANLRDCMWILKERGVCEEMFWPYVPRVEGEPNYHADDNAARYKIKNYARVTRARDVKQAIYSFGPILAGVLVYKTMLKVKEDGIVQDPQMWWPSNWRPLGGHAIALVGWKLIKGKTYYIFKNSWGEKWGDKGYGYLSEDYIKNHMLDCFSCVDLEGSEHVVLGDVGEEWEK